MRPLAERRALTGVVKRMAFCPECGKAATPEASRCVYCGFELGPKEKRAAGARFKGTMMMAQPAGQPAEPANVNAAVVTKPPPAVIVQQPAAPAAPLPKASSAKATMIGPGIAPLIAAAKAAPAPATPAVSDRAAPAARAVKPAAATAVAFAVAPAQNDPQPHGGGARQPAPIAQQAALPDPDAYAANPEAQRYLPGDPMSPAAREKSASRAGRLREAGASQPSAAGKRSSPRLTLDEDVPISTPTKDNRLLYLAAGVFALIVILAFVMLN